MMSDVCVHIEISLILMLHTALLIQILQASLSGSDGFQLRVVGYTVICYQHYWLLTTHTQLQILELIQYKKNSLFLGIVVGVDCAFLVKYEVM